MNRIDKNKLDRLKAALLEYQYFNRIRNDLDAYLFDIGDWALNNFDKKPDRKDYGILEND